MDKNKIVLTPAQRRIVDLMRDGYTVQRSSYQGRFGTCPARCWKKEADGRYVNVRVSDTTLRILTFYGIIRKDKDGILILIEDTPSLTHPDPKPLTG